MNIAIRGEWYKIDKNGYIYGGPNKITEPSANWRFLGVSFHHWRKSIDIPFLEIAANPQCAIGGLMWDCDHGDVRQWGGSYLGKLPRITAVTV